MMKIFLFLLSFISTYVATDFNGQLYWTYGYSKYDLYNLDKGNLTKKLRTTKNLAYIQKEIISFNEKLYFIGVDSFDFQHLYSMDKNDQIRDVSGNYGEIKFLQTTGDRLYFSGITFGSNKEIFSLKAENERIQKHSDLKLVEKNTRTRIVEIGDKIFWFINSPFLTYISPPKKCLIWLLT